MKIFTKIGQERDIYNEDVQVAVGYRHNTPQTLRKIDLYYGSRFLTGETDNENFKKLFINIIKHRVATATKSIDLDTKHIRVIAEEGASYFPAWFFSKELKDYMKKERFGKLLNQISTRLPRYGTVVVKDVGGKPMFVNIRNVRLDPSVDSIKNSPFVHEEHCYSLDEFMEMAEKKGWKYADEIRKTALDNNIGEITVVERYGYLQKGDVDEQDMSFEIKDGEYKKATVLCVGIADDPESPYTDTTKEKVMGQWVIDTMETDECAYRDLHWDKEDGRWLGVGIVEDMFINQEYFNDITHMERKALYWYSKVLFKTNDENLPRNLFQKTRNGDVLKMSANGDINLLPMQERNLPQYNSLYERIQNHSDQQTFTFDVNTGESLPSGTPYRLGAILSNAVNTHFAQKREDYGLFVKDLITDFIVPSFKKSKRKAHVLNFDGEAKDIELFDELIANHILKKAMIKFEKETGKLPTPIEFARERERVLGKLRQRDTRYAELPEGFYDNIMSDIEIVITGESENIQSDIETLSNLHQILAQTNPEQAQRVLEMIMNLAGKNPKSVLRGGAAPAQQPAQAGVAPQSAPNPLEAQLGGERVLQP